MRRPKKSIRDGNSIRDRVPEIRQGDVNTPFSHIHLSRLAGIMSDYPFALNLYS